MYRGEVPAVYDPPYRSVPDDSPGRGKMQVADLSPESLKTGVPRQVLPLYQENIRIPLSLLCSEFRMENKHKRSVFF